MFNLNFEKMSNFKKKILQILYKSNICLDSKKNTNHRSNIFETIRANNNKIYKKGYLSNHNNRNYNLFTVSDKENNKNAMNISTMPQNKSSEKLLISKISKENNNKIRNDYFTLFNMSFDIKKHMLFKRYSTISNELNNNDKTKMKKNGIPNCSNYNLNIVKRKLEYNKSHINIKNNNSKIKLFRNFNISQIKKLKLNKNLIKNKFNLNKKIITVNDLPPLKQTYNTISRNDIKMNENSKSNNKIKDKIIKMEKEFSSNELKRKLINRPMRTLNSKLFQFNSNDLNCFSPTLHLLNNSRTKQYNEKKNNNLFGERYNIDTIKVFTRKYTTINDLYNNNKLNRSKKSNIFDMSDINNKSIKKDNIFNTKIKLNSNKDSKDLYKEIIKYKNFYKIPVITSEYKKCCKYINNRNTRYLKDNLLTSFTNYNLEYSSRTNQFSF